MEKQSKKPNKYERVSKFCHWIKKSDGTYRWQIRTLTKKFDKILHEWMVDSDIISEKTPQEMGLTRQFEIDILFCKEIEDKSEWNSVSKMWFNQKMHYALQSDMGENVWLKYDDELLMVKDIEPYGGSGGTCCEIGLGESNANYICKKSKPIKVTAEQAVEIQKQTHSKYVYDKIESSGNEITYITTC